MRTTGFVASLVFAAMAATSLAAEEDIVWGKDLTLKGEAVGEAADLASLQGTPFVLYWGSVKCGRCVASIDDLSRMARSLQRKDIPVIAVQSEAATPEQVTEFVKEHRLKLPFFPSNGNVSFLTSHPGLTPLFRGIPRYMVFDAEGRMSAYFGDAGEARRAVEKLAK